MEEFELPDEVESVLEEADILDLYGGKCALQPWHKAVALHEEPPRSLNPGWKEEPWNRYPLCAACHEYLQNMPRDQAQALLDVAARNFFPGVRERIKSQYEKSHVWGDNRKEG